MKNKFIFLTLLTCGSVSSNLLALTAMQQKALNIATGIAAGATAVWSAVGMASNASEAREAYTDWRDFLSNEQDCWSRCDAAASYAYATYHLGKTSVDCLSLNAEEVKEEKALNHKRWLNILKGAGHTYVAVISISTMYSFMKSFMEEDHDTASDYAFNASKFAPLAYGLYKSSTEAYKKFKLAAAKNN